MPSVSGGGGERRSRSPMSARERLPLDHQDELRVGHAVDPEDPVVRDETRLFRRVDRLLSDEVPDRRESELGGESFLRDDVALVELADLDLELAFAERLANQVRVRGGDFAHPVLDDPYRTLRVFRVDRLAQPEPSAGLREPDDRLQLARGDRYAGARGLPGLPDL